MIKYRPHKGNLSDAMKEEKHFGTIEEMFSYIVEEWNKKLDAFGINDLILGEDKGKDERIGWKETRYICTKRIGKDVYSIPQCIGMCSIE